MFRLLRSTRRISTSSSWITVDDDILEYMKAPQTGAQVLITGAPYVGMAGKQKEAVSDGIDQTVGNLDAAALADDLIPNLVEV